MGVPELLDTYRTDAFRMGQLRMGQITIQVREFSAPLSPKLALRRFRPPCPAQVWCTGEGKPARIFSSIAGGSVVAGCGPVANVGRQVGECGLGIAKNGMCGDPGYQRIPDLSGLTKSTGFWSG